MLNLWAPFRRRSRPAPTRRFRPALEGLESRFCPATPIAQLSLTNPTSGAETVGSLNFAVTLSEASSDTVTVNYHTANGMALAGADFHASSGTLVFAPGETSKTFSVSIIDDSIQEPNENFTVGLSTATNAIVGAANAQSVMIIDNDTAVPPPPPPPPPAPPPPPPAPPPIPPAVPTSLVMNVAYGSGHTITITGRVEGTGVANQTVTFTGAVPTGTQVVTDSQGNYSLTVQATQLGTITGSVSYGGSTVTRQVTLTNLAPQILDYRAIAGPGNIWTIEGRVVDEYATGLTVTFGGDPDSLAGRTATVDSTGWFRLSIQFDGTLNDDGFAEARILQDWWSLASASVYTFISQSGA